MKITTIIFCIACFSAFAGDEPLMPAPLNAMISKIQPSMTTNQVVAILLPVYPKVDVHMSTWSGQTGYMDYKLDERFTLSVSSIMRDSKELVHDNLLFYVFDLQTKRRVDISVYDWERQTHKDPSQK